MYNYLLMFMILFYCCCEKSKTDDVANIQKEENGNEPKNLLNMYQECILWLWFIEFLRRISVCLSGWQRFKYVLEWEYKSHTRVKEKAEEKRYKIQYNV